MIFTPTCSGLYRLMGSAKSIDDALITDDVKAIQAKTKAKRADDEQLLLDDLLSQTLSSTAKEYIEEMLIQAKYGIRKFKGNKYTEKGNMVENDAIDFLMQHEFIFAEKNTERLNDGTLSGEWDVFYNGVIYDTKCSWDYFTMPKTRKNIESHTLDKGYDWQQLGYMRLLKNKGVEVSHAEVKYVLMPTPAELLYGQDEFELHHDFVLSLPVEKRIKTHRIEWCENRNKLIDIKVKSAQVYAEQVFGEI